MIREATEADIPLLLKWGQDFSDAAGLPGGFDPDSAADFFRHMIAMRNGILLMGDGGAIGGIYHPSPYNAEHLTGQELFWWVDPAHRGGRLGIALLEALEAAVVAAGVHSWTVSSVGLDGGRLGPVFERRGYRLTDRNYTKTFQEVA